MFTQVASEFLAIIEEYLEFRRQGDRVVAELSLIGDKLIYSGKPRIKPSNIRSYIEENGPDLIKENDSTRDYRKMYWDLIGNLRKIVDQASGVV
jgi:hypothetical protein